MHSPLSNCFLRPRSSSSASSKSTSSAQQPKRDSSPARSSEAQTESESAVATSSETQLGNQSFDAWSSAALSGLSLSEYASFRSTPFSSAHFSPLRRSAAAAASPFPVFSSPSVSSTSTYPSPSPFSLNVPLEQSSYQAIATSAGASSSLSLSDEFLYSGLPSGDVSICARLSLTERCRFGIGNGVVRALLVHHDTIFTAHDDHKIRVWRRGRGSKRIKLAGTLPSTRDYVINALTDKNYIHVRRHHRRVWIQHVDYITALAVGRDGNLLYSASWDKTVKVWKVSSMRCVQSVRAHDDAVNAMVVGADDLLYTASSDRTLKVWRRVGLQRVLLTTLEGHGAGVNALAVRGDGSVLYSASSDCTIKVWERRETKEGVKCGMKVAFTLKGHKQAVLCLAVAGPLLCSGSADRSVRLWRRLSCSSHEYTCLGVLQGHSGPVKSVCVSMSTIRACFVYSAALDSTTRVWSVAFEREGEGTILDTPSSFRQPLALTPTRTLTPPYRNPPLPAPTAHTPPPHAHSNPRQLPHLHSPHVTLP